MSDKIERPLSPHLQIYRWKLCMLTSILHRFTGVALAAGTVLMTWMLLAAATGPGPYEQFTWFCGTYLGQIMLFGWSVALFYHLSNGIRHLLWDMVMFMDKEKADAAGIVVIIATIIFTATLWGSIWFLQPLDGYQ